MKPERIGQYRVTSELGAGGMGEVFLARQTGVEGFDRPCVVKVMHESMAANPESVELFLARQRGEE